MGSESARDLAHSLGVKRLRENTRYKPKGSTLVINWGTSHSSLSAPNWLNKPSAVSKAANKLSAFQVFKQAGISIPDFTTDKTKAQTWLDSGHKVVERHKLNGTNGIGINIIKPDENDLTNAPLYVKYQKKDKEYRVHVFKNSIIDLTEKRKKVGFQGEANPYIRNLDNGWVYCRDSIYASDALKNEAIKAVQALGLDFGAVDIIEKAGKVYVLEVNCAPGIQGTTLNKYVDAIKSHRQENSYVQTRPNRNYYRY